MNSNFSARRLRRLPHHLDTHTSSVKLAVAAREPHSGKRSLKRASPASTFLNPSAAGWASRNLQWSLKRRRPLVAHSSCSSSPRQFAEKYWLDLARKTSSSVGFPVLGLDHRRWPLPSPSQMLVRILIRWKPLPSAQKTSGQSQGRSTTSPASTTRKICSSSRRREPTHRPVVVS